MKKVSKGVWCAMLLLISNIYVLSAQGIKADKFNISIPVIEVANDKTINLVFPYSIISVDRGSNAVIVQKAKGVENVLQLKAVEENFQQTNLTVITNDGSLFSFMLVFNNHPYQTNYVLSEMMPSRVVAELSDTKLNEATLYRKTKEIASKSAFLKAPADKVHGISISTQGIYINNGIMYFQLLLANDTQIDYDGEQFRFYIKDKKVTKRTASQELEIIPILIEGQAKIIPAVSNVSIVVAMEKFTIPDKKIMYIELLEKNGGRNLLIKLDNKDLIKCRKL